MAPAVDKESNTAFFVVGNLSPNLYGAERPGAAGQHCDNIIQQLTDFKARPRTNDAGTMTSVANTVSAQDIENLAHYLVGL